MNFYHLVLTLYVGRRMDKKRLKTYRCGHGRLQWISAGKERVSVFIHRSDREGLT